MYGLVLELDSSAHTVLLEVTVDHVLLGPESTDHCTLTTCCRGASHELHSPLVLARCPWLILGDLLLVQLFLRKQQNTIRAHCNTTLLAMP